MAPTRPSSRCHEAVALLRARAEMAPEEGEEGREEARQESGEEDAKKAAKKRAKTAKKPAKKATGQDRRRCGRIDSLRIEERAT